jgi:class 3 adenylate cyclase
VYQKTIAEVIQRYDGYIAQYLGDGILAYFGTRRRMKTMPHAPCGGVEIITTRNKFLSLREGQGEGEILSLLQIPLTLAFSPKGRGDYRFASASTPARWSWARWAAAVATNS